MIRMSRNRKSINLKNLNTTLNKMLAQGYYKYQECIENRGFVHRYLKSRKKNVK